MLASVQSRVLNKDEKLLHFRNWVERRSTMSMFVPLRVSILFIAFQTFSVLTFSMANEDQAAYHYAIVPFGSEKEYRFNIKNHNALLMKVY